MKKKEIIDTVCEFIQDTSAAAVGLVGRWTNIVLDDLASRGLLTSLQREESAALVAGNGVDLNLGRNYDLAPDTDKVFKVFVPGWGYPDGILTKRRPERFLREMLSDGALLTGRPRIYMIFAAKTLRLHPIPSADFAPVGPTALQKLYVWKYKDIAHLGQDDEITEITVKHTPLLISGAYAHGARFDSLGDYTSTKQEYERHIVDFFFDQENDPEVARQTAYNDL
jgi:hypothetical protein